MKKVLLAMLGLACLTAVSSTCPKQCKCTSNAELSCYRENITSEVLKTLVKQLPTNATMISLVENLLTYFPVELFENFTKLVELKLGGNHINVFPKNFSKVIPSLEILFMNTNGFTALKASDLQGYENLKTLDLYGNLFSKLDNKVFSNAPNLENLFLEGNVISEISSGAFFGLSKLKQLTVEKNKITNLLNGTFDGLTKLQKLWLSDNSLTELHPQLFEDLTGIYDINIVNNSISEIKPGTFNKLEPDNIDLSGNQLTTLDKKAFDGTKIYVKLKLDRNPINCDCHLYEFYQELNDRQTFSMTGDCHHTSSNLTIMDMVRKNPLNCSVCTYNPCKNNGVCTVVNAKKYTCSCPFGFRGDNCEEKIMCAINPCLNNGTCNVLNRTAFSCNCSDEFKGDICQIKKVCFDNPCHHNGTCMEVSNTEYKCNCKKGFEGKNCKSEHREHGLGAGWIILIVLAILAVIGVIIVVVVYRRKNPQEKTGEKMPLKKANV